VNSSIANLYADSTFALGGFSLTDGSNTFTAIAKDSYGRVDTNSVTVNLPATNSYNYDLNGNLLYDEQKVYDYDDENQMIRVTVTNSWKSEFTYDGKFRRRIEKDFAWRSGSWLQTNETHYTYDGNVILQERDTSNAPLVTYTRGNDLSGTLQGAGGIGGLLARTDANSSAFYHADGNGNVTCLINALQLIVARYEYDSYGNILFAIGSLADANTMQFSSMPKHQSGLILFLRRPYDPILQRFLGCDPIQESGGINLYRFVRNNPVNSIDWLGLNDCSIVIYLGHNTTVPQGTINVGRCSAAAVVSCGSMGQSNPGVPTIPIPGTSSVPPGASITIDQGADMALNDFNLGVAYANNRCANKGCKCLCKAITVRIECDFGWYLLDRMAVPSGVCGKTTTITCGP